MPKHPPLLLCQLTQSGCPNCLRPIPGSWGLTARAVCRHAAGNGCFHRDEDGDGLQPVDLGDMLVVAGYDSRGLFRAGPGQLYDVLPAIAPEEWEILLSFARDYTARKIPWMVVRNGRSFALLKRRNVMEGRG